MAMQASSILPLPFRRGFADGVHLVLCQVVKAVNHLMAFRAVGGIARCGWRTYAYNRTITAYVRQVHPIARPGRRMAQRMSSSTPAPAASSLGGIDPDPDSLCKRNRALNIVLIYQKIFFVSHYENPVARKQQMAIRPNTPP